MIKKVTISTQFATVIQTMKLPLKHSDLTEILKLIMYQLVKIYSSQEKGLDIFF